MRGERIVVVDLEQETGPTRTPSRARAEVRVEAFEQLDCPIGVVAVQVADRDFLEEVVAPEELVGSLAGHHDLEVVLVDLPGQQVERHRGGADQGDLSVANHLRERVPDLRGSGDDHVVARAQRRGDQFLFGALVVCRVVERDRESPQLALLLDLSQGADQTRVEAAGQVGPDRHVRPQSHGDAVSQGRLELRVTPRLLRPGPPPAPALDDLAALPDQQPARLELLDPGERRLRRLRCPERERLVDAPHVDRRGDLAGGEQRLRLGAEDQCAVVAPRPVQRAHPEPVPHQGQTTSPRLPPGEGELPVQAPEALRTLELEERMDDLRVASRPELHATRAHPFPQLGMVVDLTVVDQDAAGAIVDERLPSVLEIHDRQSGRHQAGARVDQKPEAVRTAMSDRPGHAQQRLLVDRIPRIGADDPRDAAHVRSPARTTPRERAGRRSRFDADRSRRRRPRPLRR